MDANPLPFSDLQERTTSRCKTRENRANASEKKIFQKTALIFRDTCETLHDTPLAKNAFREKTPKKRLTNGQPAKTILLLNNVNYGNISPVSVNFYFFFLNFH